MSLVVYGVTPGFSFARGKPNVTTLAGNTYSKCAKLAVGVAFIAPFIVVKHIRQLVNQFFCAGADCILVLVQTSGMDFIHQIRFVREPIVVFQKRLDALKDGDDDAVDDVL